MLRSRFVGILCLVGLGLLVACGGGGTGGSTGALVLSVTDGPFDEEGCLAAAWIAIDGVTARSGGEWITIDLVDPDPELGTVVLDLLALRNGLEENVAFAAIPVGELDEIRLHLAGATLEFPDKLMQPFKVPSGMSSGLKLKIDPPILVAAGQTASLTFDIDVAASFHTTGVGGDPECEELRSGEAGVIFSPVVRILNDATHGMLKGLVTDSAGTPLEGAEVIAYTPGTTEPVVTHTFSATATDLVLDAGGYALLLDPGSYDIYVDADDADEIDPVLVTTVVIGEAEVVEETLALPAP